MPATAPQDSRFDTSAWSAQEAEAGPSKSAQSPASDEGSEAEDDDEQDDEQEELDDDELDDAEGNSPPLPSSLIPTLTPKELEAFERKQRKRGIIYISRIPPGMTPPKVRHLLSGFGEVERIYLQDGRRKEREREQGSVGSQRGKKTRRFTEGWIEFSSKSVAKIVATTLNAQPIGFSSGGRKSNKNARRWQDDVWTMKYLPGFKWHMLSEQMAHERAAHASRLRTELSQSKVEQQDYLKKVERHRVQKLKEEKRKAREGGEGAKAKASQGSAVTAAPGKQQSEEQQQRVRTFKQRKPILRDVREQEAAASGSGSGGGDKKRKRAGDGDSGERSSRPRGGNDGSGALSGVLSKIL